MKCKDCLSFECERRGFPETECFYEEELRKQKELEEIPYWEHFRAEAAKDILCAVLQNDGVGGRESEYVKNCVMVSLLFTDELIKQLKEKEEK